MANGTWTITVTMVGFETMTREVTLPSSAEGVWELSLMPWDMAAGMLLVREAGGVVTDLAGAPATVGAGGLVAGSPAMHGWLLALLHERDG